MAIPVQVLSQGVNLSSIHYGMKTGSLKLSRYLNSSIYLIFVVQDL
jgi:hypothetical protein